MAAAGTAALMAGEPQIAARRSTRRRRSSIRSPKADACILLWMAGGMAAPETFDPKRYQPFEVGLPVEKVMSTFPAIDTAVDNIKICQGLENIAKVMDRGTLIRSHVLPDLGHILHSRHQYHWHTGYVPPQTVAAPHIGAWMARVLGPRNPVIPPFINIGQRLEGNGETEELKAFTTGGFFGTEFGPFNLPFPDDAIDAVRPPKGMDAGRFENRYQLYQEAGRSTARSASTPATISRSRCCARSTTPIGCSSSKEQAGVRPVAGAEGELRQVQHRPLRPRLPAGAAAGRGGRPVHRSDDRVHAVRPLGHARERPRHGRADEAGDRPADRPAHSRPGRPRPAGPHAGRPRQRVQPRHDDRRRARQHGQGPVARQDRRA